jgi:hypothetical protein
MWSSVIVGKLSDHWNNLRLAVLILPAALFVGALLWLALAWQTLKEKETTSPKTG